jgi:hypothetical protein
MRRKELTQMLLNVKNCGLVLAPRLKKGDHKMWATNLQTLGQMSQHLLIS